MKIMTILITFLVTLSVQADVFSDYQSKGIEALNMSKQIQINKTEFVNKIKEMTFLGYKIMDLYLQKYPVCSEQFIQLKNVDSEILNMSYDRIDSLYHEGEGLIQAPRVCYKGRSLVVHPYQVAALAQENRLQSDAASVDHELKEVIERAGKIKIDLGI